MGYKNVDPFHTGHFYHIYNKAIGKEYLFFDEKNYSFFLTRFNKYLSEYLEAYSYCLIPNHFHFLVRVKRNGRYKETSDKKITDQFRKFFISYAQAINKQENRTGSLFKKKFKRKQIKDKTNLLWVIYYIHRNPLHHHLSKDFRNYKWSSYQALVSHKKTSLKREEIHESFGGEAAFKSFHEQNMENDLKNYRYLFIE